MRIEILHRLIILAAGGIFFALVTGAADASAQNVVVLVNDEPITSGDVAQRTRWNARTNGFGDRLKAILTGDSIKERFRQEMIKANPRSQAEAEQAAERIKKQLLEDAKNRVLSDGGGRKAAIDALIEDKLKMQAAKKLDISAGRCGAYVNSGLESWLKCAISDAEVEQVLARNAAGAPQEGKKPDLSDFYKQFENDGINRKTVQEIIRAQLAWRDVIRRRYGAQLASLLSALPNTDEKPSESDIQFDVRVLRLSVASTDQKAVSQRIIEAENLKEKFTTCAQLPNEAKLVSDATVRSIEKAKLASFPKDVQPLIQKASEGQMTPPVLVGSAIESYAICRKGVAAKAPKAAAEQKPDVRQQEYDRFSRRYLQELKQAASIDYRGS
jgi:peptidyl-prolyl cis-trans isomerase SurA